MPSSSSSRIRLESFRNSRPDEIHSRALRACACYRTAEVEVIKILMEIDQHRVYLKRGHPNLFHYIITELGLSESVAYSMMGVARKMKEVPELKASLESGKLTLTNARRIVPLLSAEMPKSDQKKWIEKASTLSSRKLEKEIVKVRPEEATREQVKYVTPSRVELKLGLSEKEMLRLRNIQDLLSQSKKRPVSLEEALQEMISLFIEKRDPIEKAKRQQVKKGGLSSVGQSAGVLIDQRSFAGHDEKVSEAGESGICKEPEFVARPNSKRVPIPAAVLHAVNLRDGRRCADSDGEKKRCQQTRWLDYHHRTPVSLGGKNTAENLVTLCSAHHKIWHLRLKKGEVFPD